MRLPAFTGRQATTRRKPTEAKSRESFVSDSFGLFSLRNPLRGACIGALDSIAAKVITAALIIAFCVLQALYRPLEPAASINKIIDWASLAITIAFTLELAAKAVAWGLVLEDNEDVSKIVRGVRAACCKGGSSLKRWLRPQRGDAAAAATHAPSFLGGMSAAAAPTTEPPLDPGGVAAAPAAAAAATPPDRHDAAPAAAAGAAATTPGCEPAAAPGSLKEAGLAALEASQQGAPAAAAPSPPHTALWCGSATPAAPPSEQFAAKAGSARGWQQLGPKLRERTDSAFEVSLKGAGKASDAPQAAPDHRLQIGAAPAAPAPAPALHGCMAVLHAKMQDAVLHAEKRGPLLRSPWGALDAALVLVTWVTFLPGLSAGTAAGSVRALRLLLPLKSVAAMPWLQACMQAVLSSMPMLGSVLLAWLFICWLFTVLGLQLYQDPLHNNCVVIDSVGPLPFATASTPYNATGYTPAGNAGQMCSLVSTSVWPGERCNVAANEQCLGGQQAPQMGQLSFDNLGAGMLFTFLITSAMWWGAVTSYLQEATVGWSFFYSLALVVSGYFLLCVVLSALGDKYMHGMEEVRRSEPSRAAKRWRTKWGRWREAAAKQWRRLPGALVTYEYGTFAWRWQLKCAVTHWAFSLATSAAVLADFVLLAMPWYGMPKPYERSLELGNKVLAYVFAAEMALKVVALGRTYFESAGNLLDCAATCGGLAALAASAGGTSASAAALRALRALRLLRMFTLRSELRRFLRRLWSAMMRTLAFGSLLLVIVLVFAQLGMALFGGKWDATTDPGAPVLDFNSFGSALVTVYDCLTGTLDPTLFYAMEATSGWAALYYILLTVMGNFVLLNLLVNVVYELYRDEEKKKRAPRRGNAPSAMLQHTWRCRGKRTLYRLLGIFPRWRGIVPRCRCRARGDMRARSVQALLSGLDESPSLLKQAVLRSVHGSQCRSRHGSQRSSPAPSQPLSPQPLSPQQPRSPQACLPGIGPPAGAAFAQQAPAPQPCGSSAAARAQQLLRYLALPAFWQQWLLPPWLPGTSQPQPAPPSDGWRVGLGFVVASKVFRWQGILTTLLNCGVMAAQNPGNSETLATWLDRAGHFFLGIYIAELAANLVAVAPPSTPRGQPESAGRDPPFWRTPRGWLDCGIVAAACLAPWSKVPWATAVLNSLRPLRLFTRVEQMEAVLSGLAASVAGVARVLLVATVFIAAWAACGLQLFMGGQHACTAAKCCSVPQDDLTCKPVQTQSECVGWSPATFDEPGGLPCQWIAWPFNFDNMWNSVVTLFVTMTGAGWADAMYHATGTSQVYQQPQQATSAWGPVFFVIYQCIAQFFIFNLFVSSILDAFIERADNRSLPRLSEDQRDWVKAHVALLGTEAAAQSGAAVQSEQPGTRLQQLRKRLQDLIKHAWFERAVVLCIFCSGVLLSLQHYQQGPAWSEAIYVGNAALTGLFCTESLVKGAALGREYLLNPWDLFDFIVTWASLPSLWMRQHGVGMVALRAVRVVRLGRLVRHLAGLKRIASALFIQLPALGNAVLVVSVVLFMFATIGCQAFYGVMPENPIGMTPFLNWNSVGNAMMLLTVAATGDAWDAFLLDCLAEPPACEGSACGSPLAGLFFLPFMLVVSCLLFGLLIALVYESWQATHPPPRFEERDFVAFRAAWSRRAPGSMFLPTDQVHGLLGEVMEPLGFKGLDGDYQQETDDMLKDIHVEPGLGVFQFDLLQYRTARTVFPPIMLQSLSETCKDLHNETAAMRAKAVKAALEAQALLALHARKHGRLPLHKLPPRQKREAERQQQLQQQAAPSGPPGHEQQQHNRRRNIAQPAVPRGLLRPKGLGGVQKRVPVGQPVHKRFSSLRPVVLAVQVQGLQQPALPDPPALGVPEAAAPAGGTVCP